MATTSPFKQQCPGCGTAILIKDPKNIGKKAECPKCHNRFVIEDPSAAEVAIEVVSETPAPAAAQTQTTPVKAPAAAAKPAAKPAAPKPAAAPPPAAAEPIEAEADAPAPAPRGFSSFKLTCPSCDAPITIKDPSQVNKKIECPRCKYRFVVEPPKGSEVLAAEAPAETKKPKKKVRFGDDRDDKPKPKVASNNLVLILGIGLSVIAVVLLGVGGYFIFFAGGEDGPTRPIGQVKGTGTGTTTQPVIPTKPIEPVLPEITNYLLNDTDFVCHVSVKELYNSIVGRAAFGSPGSFKQEQVAQAVGHLPEEIDRIVVGYRLSKGNGLAVVRTAKDIDLDKLKERLGLEPGSDSPFKKQEYFLARPSAWLANVRRILGESVGLPAPPAKPVQLALRMLDKRTLVVGDLDSLKEFMEANGQPKVQSAVIDPKAPKKVISNRFLTLNPNFKALLDRLEAKGPMATLAWNQEGQGAALKSVEGLVPAKLALVSDLLRDSGSLGLALSLRDSVVLTAGSDLKNPELDKTIESELRKFSQAFSQMGVNTELNGQMFYPPANPNLLPVHQRPVQKLAFKTSSAGRLIVVEAEVQLGLAGGGYLHSQILRPMLLTARGVADMAESRPRLFELAIALQAWTKKNQKFPSGTTARKPSAIGRTATPDQRLSWLIELLPHLGHEDVYKNLKQELSWRPEIDPLDKQARVVDDNARLGNVLIPAFLDADSPLSDWWLSMASAPGYPLAATHYVGVAGVGLDAADFTRDDPANLPKLGVFGYDRETLLGDLTDGPAGTIAVLQVPPTYRRPWIAGGGATVSGVPENGSIKPFVCKVYQDKKGTFAIMADGAVRFIPETISDEAFKALCTIAGGEKVDLDKETILVPPPKGTSELKTVTQR